MAQHGNELFSAHGDNIVASMPGRIAGHLRLFWQRNGATIES